MSRKAFDTTALSPFSSPHLPLVFRLSSASSHQGGGWACLGATTQLSGGQTGSSGWEEKKKCQKRRAGPPGGPSVVTPNHRTFTADSAVRRLRAEAQNQTVRVGCRYPHDQAPWGQAVAFWGTEKIIRLCMNTHVPIRLDADG